FPSYWNVVAFYVVVLDLSPAVTTVILVGLAVLAFVPVCYLYPSRTRALWRPTMIATTIWLVLYAVITAFYPDPPTWAVAASMVYLAYYAGVSVVMTLLRQRSPTTARPPWSAALVELHALARRHP